MAINNEIVEAEKLAIVGKGTPPLIDVFRNNLKMWEKYLFPLWEIVGISQNEKIAEVLRNNGYPNVNAGQVATYIYRIRLEKKNKGKSKE